MNEKDIIELYRTQVNSRNESPPEIVWNEIHSQLDIEDTWDSISIELDKVLPLTNEVQSLPSGEKLNTLTKALSIITPVVFTLLLLLYDTRESDLLIPEQSGVNISAVSVDKPGYSIDNNEEKIISKKQGGSTKNVTNIISSLPESIKPNGLLSEPLTSVVENIVTEEVSKYFRRNSLLTQVNNYPDVVTLIPADSYFSTVNIKDLSRGMSVLHPFVIMTSPLTPLVSAFGKSNNIESTLIGPKSSGRTPRMSKFSIGISLIEKNTWLISRETFDGLDRQNLNTTRAKFLSDLGIILRYKQSEKWSFEGSWFLLSKTGQSYRQYLNGIYSSKSYDLRYFSYEMCVRYSANSLLNLRNVRLNYLSGAWVSHLNSATKSINHSFYDVSSDYNPIDYGLIVGSELEISILDRFAVSPGLRIKYGIPNIFADKPGIPKEMHATRNASLEFRLNLTIPFSNF